MQHDDPRFTPQAAAEYLEVSEATLAWWRWKGRGPAFEKPAGRIHYRKSALDRFISAGVVTPAERDTAA